jgi:hypothetical protein
MPLWQNATPQFMQRLALRALFIERKVHHDIVEIPHRFKSGLDSVFVTVDYEKCSRFAHCPHPIYLQPTRPIATQPIATQPIATRPIATFALPANKFPERALHSGF